MVRTQIQLEERQFQWLKAAALEKGLSMAEIIRDCIDSYQDRQSHEVLKQKALKAVGCFASGKRDVSSNHDVYLAEAYVSE